MDLEDGREQAHRHHARVHHRRQGDLVVGVPFTFVYQIGLCFVGVLVWNLISPWPITWWSHYFFINSLCVAGVIGIVSTVWFLIGGIINVRRLFKDLKARVDNPLDDGRVKGHVSLMDVAVLGKDAEDK